MNYYKLNPGNELLEWFFSPKFLRSILIFREKKILYDTIFFHKNSYEKTCVSETLDFSYEILQLKYYEKS